MEASAQQFRGVGKVTYGFETSFVKRTNALSLRFLIERNKSVWKIRTWPEPAGDSPIAFYEAGCDGSNIFYLQQNDREKLKKIVGKKIEEDNFAIAKGEVLGRVIPRYRTDLLGCVWQAYASLSYFQHLTNARAISPRFEIVNMVPEVEQKVVWRAITPGFISSVDWFADGTYVIQAASGSLVTNEYNKPYSEGFLQGTFENLSWTNIGTLAVPKAFALTVYSPASKGASSGEKKLSVSYRVSGVLEELENLSSLSYLPKLTSKTIITDFRRTSQGTPVAYMTSSGWILNPDKLLSSSRTSSTLPVPPKRRLLTLTFLVLFTVMFAFLMFKHHNDINK